MDDLGTVNIDVYLLDWRTAMRSATYLNCSVSCCTIPCCVIPCPQGRGTCSVEGLLVVLHNGDFPHQFGAQSWRPCNNIFCIPWVVSRPNTWTWLAKTLGLWVAALATVLVACQHHMTPHGSMLKKRTPSQQQSGDHRKPRMDEAQAQETSLNPID